MSIYIGNLSYEVNEEDLKEVFAEYGSVARISMPIDKYTGRKRGFAFVEMSSTTEEDAAIEKLDGSEWMGRELKVNKARERKPRDNNNATTNTNRGNFGGGGGRGRRRY